MDSPDIEQLKGQGHSQVNDQLAPQQQELLQQLRDISLPEDPGWWPPAVGWWLLMIAVLGLMAIVVWLFKKHAMHKSNNAWRRLALDEHSALQQSILRGDDHSGAIAQLSVLMRRVALAVEPRGNIASLTDDQWLQKLDSIGGTNGYTNGVGSVLYRHQYQRAQKLDEDTVSSLFALTADTIRNAKPAALADVRVDAQVDARADVDQPKGGSVAAL